MVIKGLQKLTLLDFPEKIAATIFTGGCNFRCPFCHNASLVVPDRFAETIPERDVMEFLRSRVGRLDGVCISGGEPTLQPDLAMFIRRVRELGFAVKLDTNGYRPDVLKSLIDEGLVDYVAMDIKNSRERYALTVGLESLDISPVEQSAALLMEGRVPFEFRTTVVRGLHTEEDVASIGEWLAGDEKFFLQTFEDSGDMVKDGFSGYTEEEMRRFVELLSEKLPRAALRGD